MYSRVSLLAARPRILATALGYILSTLSHGRRPRAAYTLNKWRRFSV
jgi:hypothetical protein